MEGLTWSPRALGGGWARDAWVSLMGLLLLGEAVVNATVEMKTKVDNRDFTADLKNKSSAAFKDFEKDFKEKVRTR